MRSRRAERAMRGVGLALAALAAVLLGGCLFAPGRFAAELDIRKEGRFSFTYRGEIHMLALSDMAAAGAPFAARPCAAADGAARPCTPGELAEQRSAWEAERRTRGERRQREAESMKALLGGIDLSSPAAAEELAQRLRRQAGWKRVVHRGVGVFDVEFALSGTLERDFAFPTVERFPMSNAFVQLTVRNDGTVRIDAPGFAPGGTGDPLRGMASGLAGEADGGAADLPQVDGRFVVRTDAAVLANNTDEGPVADPAGQRLAWAVNPRTPAAPMALLRLAR